MKRAAAARSNGEARFVKLDHALIDGPAFAKLSAGATRLIVLLLRRYNGRNNGEISCSIREAAAWCHCRKSQAAEYFHELCEVGLIAVNTKGHLTKAYAAKNVATTWKLAFVPYQESRS